MAGTVCPHCQHQRTDADSGVPEWLCPGCGKKYYEAPRPRGMFERVYDAVFCPPPEKWPAAWPCKACKKKVSRDAVVCPHCGQPAPYGYKPIYAPFAEAPASHKLSAIVVLGLGLFVLLGMARCATSPTPPDHSDATASYICQQYIKELLKSPQSAVFSGEAVSKVHDDLVIATGMVDAQNTFSAQIRNRYECQLTRGGQSWVLVGGKVSGR